uniref:group II intron reverse transcriptase/maturase n=1 Tax=Hormidiella parvula TaxID=2058785 RepID=UPI00286BD2C3|nr:group II intron reverse transcriptase/maturase [Hormidiella parvula]YP_010932397.1 group II intron reverse transcriptase/maturase [Hormidiella parvula]WKT05965.1 group II intron reverse transcriptase/maturase [Hormidiella parvula]WKT05966.1 group II intron reverse transcriptase/maturase [Hormidiella parvula]
MILHTTSRRTRATVRRARCCACVLSTLQKRTYKAEESHVLPDIASPNQREPFSASACPPMPMGSAGANRPRAVQGSPPRSSTRLGGRPGRTHAAREEAPQAHGYHCEPSWASLPMAARSLCHRLQPTPTYTLRVQVLCHPRQSPVGSDGDFRSAELSTRLVLIHKDLACLKACHSSLQDWISRLGWEIHPLTTRMSHSSMCLHHQPAGLWWASWHTRQLATIPSHPVGRSTPAPHPPRGQGVGRGALFQTRVGSSSSSRQGHLNHLAHIVRGRYACSRALLAAEFNPAIQAWSSCVPHRAREEARRADSRLLAGLSRWGVRRQETGPCANRAKGGNAFEQEGPEMTRAGLAPANSTAPPSTHLSGKPRPHASALRIEARSLRGAV